MKTIYSALFSMLLLLIAHKLSAQLPQIIGATRSGGDYGLGIIYKTNLDGTGFTPVYSFSSLGYVLAGKLVQAPNKLLYGATEYGGPNDDGCLFSYDPVNNIYKDVFDFNYINGSHPAGGLLLASSGLLYGTTYYGGSSGEGVAFSFNPVTNVYTLLFQFANTAAGVRPKCTLIQGSDGKLYGTTEYGGANDFGVIFSFDISNNIYKKLHVFTTQVHNPYGALVEAPNGSFYGFAITTGDYNAVYVSAAKTVSLIHNFGGTTSGNNAALVRDNFKPNILYGASPDAQSGEIFSINTNDNSYNKGHAFTGTDGSDPEGGLLNLSNNLYGVTLDGGLSGYGVILENTSSGIVKTLHDFTGNAGGGYPNVGIITVPCTAVPARPGGITGNTASTCNKTKKYYISRVSGSTSYTWTVPAGATIQGASNDTAITILWGTQSGDVSVKASNYCGTSPKKSLAVTVSCTGKESEATTAQFVSAASVFPNPTAGNISIKFYSSNSSKYTIRVLDITGRILLTHETNSSAGENTVQFNLGKFAKGVYYIELTGSTSKQVLKAELR